MSGNNIVMEELEMAWGKELAEECYAEAKAIRAAAWEKAMEGMHNRVVTIDFEPSPELVLAVAIRKLLMGSWAYFKVIPKLDFIKITAQSEHIEE